MTSHESCSIGSHGVFGRKPLINRSYWHLTLDTGYRHNLEWKRSRSRYWKTMWEDFVRFHNITSKQTKLQNNFTHARMTLWMTFVWRWLLIDLAVSCSYLVSFRNLISPNLGPSLYLSVRDVDHRLISIIHVDIYTPSQSQSVIQYFAEL